jgi:enterochelin esterase-like enzyme
MLHSNPERWFRYHCEAMFRTIFTALSLAALLFAQPAPQPVQSPIVNADKSVTFRMRSTQAQKVEVSLEGGKRFELAKDEKGIWAFTTPPLTPDIYGYSYIVDGVGVIDPVNGDMKTNALNPQGMVMVPGDTPQPWEFTNIPHGAVHRHFFHSAVAGENRDFLVYTPPAWDPRKTYPLLVLLHGYSDLADGWTTVGKANFIFDQLIASGRKPFICVMPLGYGMSQKDLKAGAVRTGDNFYRNTVGFEKSLMEEVLPAAENAYKVSTRPTERAISGLSMGGAETLFVGLRHLDRFAWIGAMSSAPQLFGKPEEAFASLSDKDNARIKLLWIACGKDDFLLRNNHAFVDWLKTKKVEHKYVETEGAHTWLVWRRYLSDFLTQVNF